MILTVRTILTLTTLAAVSGPLIQAQTQSAESISFEVASVKAHEFPAGVYVGGTGGTIRISGNRVTILGNLMGFVMAAYNLRDYQVSDAPGWTDKQGRQQDYDISATAEGEGALTMDQARRMLQTLLADRFQLRVHRETKEMPVYDLVVSKNGPKMKESAPDTKPDTNIITASSALWKIKWSNLSMADFVSRIASNFDRPVLDRTGLKAGYDFTLEYTRSNPELIARDSPDFDNSIFTAVQEQLGLRLAPAKEPVEILVID